MKYIVWLFLAWSGLAFGADAPARCPWIFFDLGAESLVVTPEPFGHGIHFTHRPGPHGDALEYTQSLHAMGYTMGLIINFPDQYLDDYVYPDGKTRVEDPTPLFHDFTKVDPDPRDPFKRDRRAAKMVLLKKIISRGWKDPHHPMDPRSWNKFWAMFGDRVLISPTDQSRKDRSSYLFEEAESMARPSGCDIIYQSPLQDELRVLQDYAGRTGGRIVPFLEGFWNGPNYYLDPFHFGTYLRSGAWRDAVFPGSQKVGQH